MNNALFQVVDNHVVTGVLVDLLLTLTNLATDFEQIESPTVSVPLGGNVELLQDGIHASCFSAADVLYFRTGRLF